MSEADFAPANDVNVNTDDLLDVLSNVHCRYALSYLQRVDDDVVKLPELVEGVLTQEADRETFRRDSVAIALHHIHLPKLAEVGLIDYDARSKTIRFDRHPERERAVAFAAGLAGDRS